MTEIEKIIKGIYFDNELRNTCIPLFLSNPGQGKTTIINNFFKSINKNCLSVIASTKMPHEFQGCAVPNHDSKLMTYYDYDELLNLQDGDCLFLDEILNANPMILNAFLTVLENRELPSGKKLANIMILAAANPQGAVQLTPQVKERFLWYDIKFDKKSWKEYMAKYLITDGMFEQLCVLINNESFSTSEKNYFTPRSIEKAIKMITRDVDTPYKKKLEPILNTMVKNGSSEEWLLEDGTLWKPDQMVPWIKTYKTHLKLVKND